MENSSLGQRARLRREKIGLTQQVVADALGISQVAVAKIEKGGKTVHGFRLARILRTTVEWLETGEGSEEAPPAGWERLDARDRAKVESFIAGLLAARSSPDEDRKSGD